MDTKNFAAAAAVAGNVYSEIAKKAIKMTQIAKQFWNATVGTSSFDNNTSYRKFLETIFFLSENHN